MVKVPRCGQQWMALPTDRGVLAQRGTAPGWHSCARPPAHPPPHMCYCGERECQASAQVPLYAHSAVTDMIDVRVADDFMVDGLAIYISRKTGGTSRLLLHLHDDGMQSWDEIDPAAITEPTLKLQGEFARALLDALLRHYQGASDMHTVRADLLHERDRVDKLTSGLLQIAIHATNSQWAGSASPPADRFGP